MRYIKLLALWALSSSMIRGEWVSITRGPVRPEVVLMESKATEIVLESRASGFSWYKVDTKNITNAPQEIFVILGMPGAHFTGEVGRPRLPIISGTVEVPHGSEISIEVVDAKYKEIALKDLGIEGKIMPALESVIKLPGARPVFKIDKELYSTDTYYPKKLTEFLEHKGYIRGHRLVTVRFFPIQYNPLKGRIRFYTHIKVRVKITGGNLGKTVQEVQKHYSPVWEKFLSKVILNYGYYTKAVIPLDIYYLIIADTMYKSEIQELAKWKKKKGFKVKIATQDSIATWTADGIRAYINAQTPWPTYVLLVGDVNGGHIPAFIGSSSTEVTDLYYSEMDYTGYLPDLYVGRISAENDTHVTTQVTKILRYEKANFSSFDWLKRTQFIASSDPTYYTVSEATHDYVISTWMNPYGFISHKSYPVTYGATNDTVTFYVEQGVGFNIYSGHGNEEGYADYDIVYPTTSIYALNNGEMTPFAATHACLTNQFDYTLSATGDCGGEAWVRNPNGGAVVYWGSSNYTYWDEDDWLERAYFDHMFQDSIWDIGRFTQAGLYYGVELSTSTLKQYYYEEYNILGDPSIEVWTDIPDTLLVVHDSSVAPGSGTFTVTVYDNDGITPLQDALVCLWIYTQSPEMHVAGYTDVNGQVTLNISPQNVGDTMWVTVTKHNYIPYEGYAIVAGAPSKPTIISPFDFARIPDALPTLQFFSTDSEGDDIQYEVKWDVNPDFSTASSDTTALYRSGDTVVYVFGTTLGNETYYWTTRGRDPAGSNYWGAYSDVRSFTVATGLLPQSTCSWYQTKGSQFNQNTFEGAAIVEGDSVVLVASSSGVDTLINEGFESGNLPAGWTSVNGGGNTQTWSVGTGATNPPPSFGTYYANIVYPTSGPSPSADTDFLLSPAKPINSSATDLILKYGWGMDFATTESLYTQVRFHNGTTWGSWITVATHVNTDGSGTDSVDLSGYLPNDSVQIRWAFYSAGGRNGQDAAVDNVLLISNYSVPNTWGKMIGTPVIFEDLASIYTRNYGWGNIIFTKSSPGDSIGIQVEYLENGVWQLVPDADLPGNSSGFFTTKKADTILIENSLPPTIYDTLRLVALFYRPSVTLLATSNPALLDWEIGNLTGIALQGVTESYITARERTEGVLIKIKGAEIGSKIELYKKEIKNKDFELIYSETLKKNEFVYLDRDVRWKKVYIYKAILKTRAGENQILGPIKVRISIFRGPLSICSITPSIFRDHAKIYFINDAKALVKLYIRDISGRKISILLEKKLSPGLYSIKWKNSSSGKILPSGIYFLILENQKKRDIKKIQIIR